MTTGSQGLHDEPGGATSDAEVFEQHRRALTGTVSLGMLVVLECQSPLKQAAFVLREGFAWGRADIAEALGRSQAAVPKLAYRAHHHVCQALRGSAWTGTSQPAPNRSCGDPALPTSGRLLADDPSGRVWRAGSVA